MTVSLLRLIGATHCAADLWRFLLQAANEKKKSVEPEAATLVVAVVNDIAAAPSEHMIGTYLIFPKRR